MTDVDILKDRVDWLEKIVESLTIAHVGIEDLNGIQIEIVGEAVRHVQNRAGTFRNRRHMDKEKQELMNQLEEIKKKLEDYP